MELSRLAGVSVPDLRAGSDMLMRFGRRKIALVEVEIGFA